MCQITVVHETPPTIHHATGLPQLSFDQFIHISKHHHAACESTSEVFWSQEMDHPDSVTINKLSSNTLTMTQLLKRSDWLEWGKSEFLQLDQYERQQMFGRPGPLPKYVKTLVFSHDMGLYYKNIWTEKGKMRGKWCTSSQRHHHSCKRICCLLEIVRISPFWGNMCYKE